VTATTTANDSYLSVGEGVELSCTIERCNRIYVAGTARLQTLCTSFVVDAKGKVEGTIDCETAEIRGNFRGEIRTRGRLIVHETGLVEGDVRYGRIEIADGGRVTGRMEWTPGAATTTPASTTATKAAVTP